MLKNIALYLVKNSYIDKTSDEVNKIKGDIVISGGQD